MILLRSQVFRLTVVCGCALALALATLFAAGSLFAAPASTLNVCATCTYTTIQSAVDAAANGDLIRIAGGTYSGVQQRVAVGVPPTPPTSVVTQVVFIAKSLVLQGGYDGSNFNTPPDPRARPTNVDAQNKGRAVYVQPNITVTLDGLRMLRGNAAGLAGCVNCSGGDAGGALYAAGDVLTVTNSVISASVASQAINPSGNSGYGGGAYIALATATLQSNVIANNTSFANGGGVYLDGATAAFTANQISGNTTGNGGGGVHSGSSMAAFTNNVFSANQQTDVVVIGGGGGLGVSGGTDLLVGNTFSRNGANASGGGLAVTFGTVSVQHNTFTNNTATVGGGGLVIALSLGIVNANLVDTNQANGAGAGVTGGGGGVAIADYSQVTLTNNAIVNNSVGASGGGSGLAIAGAMVMGEHNTIARNSGGTIVAGIVVTGGVLTPVTATVQLTNSIVVSNGTGLFVAPGSLVTLNDVLWFGQSPNTTGVVTLLNQHTGNPKFAADGYHLTQSSAARGLGVLTGVLADIDGDPRPAVGADLGADQFLLKFLFLPLIRR